MCLHLQKLFANMINSRILKQWPLFLASAIALVHFEQAGVSMGWSSPVLPQLQSANSTLFVTPGEGSWLATVPQSVAAVCTPLAFVGMQYLGLKRSIALAVVPCLVSWTMIALASSVTELMIARGVLGITAAFTYTAVPVYLGEISPDGVRGGIALCMNVFICVGILWIYVIGVLPELWLSSLLSALPLLLIVVLYAWLPESPYFLIAKGKRAEAEEALRQLRNSDSVEDELRKIEEIVSNKTNGNGVKKLFTQRAHLKALMIVLGTAMILQFSGTMTFVYFAHIIFQKAGNADPDKMAIIKASLQLVTAVGSAFVVDSFGRRPLLLMSIVGCACCTCAEGVYFFLLDNGYNTDAVWWLPLVAMVLFNVSQSMGLTSIPLAYIGEFFHPEVKSLGTCLSKSFAALCSFSVGQLFQLLAESFGNSAPFFFFSGMCVLGAVFVFALVPETKGRSMSEIQYYLKNNVYESNKCN